MSSSLPKAIQKQQEQADEALAQYEAAQVGDDQPTSAAETAANTQDNLTEPTAQPTPAAQTPEPQAAPETGETSEMLKKLEAKFNVLKGKYDHEVPRYVSKLRELEKQNNELKDELDEEKNKVAKELDPNAYKKYLLEDERDELDPALMDLQGRVARGVAEDISSKETSELQKKVKDLELLLSDLSNTQADARGANFWRDADLLAPGVANANEVGEEAWVEFLDSVDPVSRLQYRVIGEAAIERGDSTAVANLYSLMKEKNTVTPDPNRVTAADQVKPDASPSAPRTGSRTTGPQIKESEISAFYNSAISKGLTQADIEAKEAEFDLAASEGRIVFGK